MHVNTAAFALVSLRLAVFPEDRWLKLEAHVVGPGGGLALQEDHSNTLTNKNKWEAGKKKIFDLEKYLIQSSPSGKLNRGMNLLIHHW